MIKLERLVLTTSLLIAGCAAYFSIYGIGLLFSGASISSMIMAGSLEIGKLVTTSWLFRNWNRSSMFVKTYMSLAVFVLICITSLGIFGYLSAAHQKSSLETELTNTKIAVLETQKQEQIKNIENVRTTIDKLLSLRSNQEFRLGESMTNTLIVRNPVQLQMIQTQINGQIEELNKQIENENTKLKISSEKSVQIDDEIFKLKLDNNQKKDITTFKFIADEFNTTVQKIVKWFIVVLITVFDPLAIVLLLAYNTSINDDKRVEFIEKIVEVEKPVEKIVEVEKPVEKIVEVEKPVEKIVEVEKPRKRAPSVKGMFSF